MTPITTRTGVALAHLANALALLAGAAVGVAITVVASSPVIGDDIAAITARILTGARTGCANAGPIAAYVVLGLLIAVVTRKALSHVLDRRAPKRFVTRRRLALRITKRRIARRAHRPRALAVGLAGRASRAAQPVIAPRAHSDGLTAIATRRGRRTHALF